LIVKLLFEQIEPGDLFEMASPASTEIAPCLALIFGSISLGGGIYETLLVDPAWLRNLSIIQPDRGGLNRKLFWGSVHPLYELALLVSAWTCWGHVALRVWLIAALVGHFTGRGWSFAYFIPQELRFEKLDKLAPEDVRSTHRWVRLSRCRPFLGALSIAAMAFVLTHLASQ
jgi:hypothetical protein